MAIHVKYTSQTISWFKDRLLEERLVFKPPFQRNPVWLDRHKAHLVDSALRGLPIPEIYIQKDTDPEGNTNFALVDGQQRIRTLLAFPQGTVELMEQYSPGRGGETWDDLSDTEKSAYWDYSLIVREITGAGDAELRDLFTRLNQNTVALNGQEIRNARYKGDFITTATELADQEFWSENRIVTPAEIRRMLDIEYMAELLLGIMHGSQNKKVGLDSAFEAYEAGIPEKQKWLRRFEAARALSQELLPDLSATRWRGKSDYYSLFLALDELSEKGALKKGRLGAADRALQRFSQGVNQQLSKDKGKPRATKEIRAYATAVEKAASDKARRETRKRIVVSLLSPYFGTRKPVT